ncbi:hypothetical protein ABIE67_010217 [Streptomyces sp. V4I8]|uniref:Tat pathway signal protein n=1 Tax=Streptomyces sp. V4I8 TaxID=3156469 RepID=UPI003513961C
MGGIYRRLMHREHERNEALIQWMTEHQMTAREFADALNQCIRELTGHQSLITERTVLKWRSGETRWPHTLHRTAIQTVTRREPAGLGFMPPRRSVSTAKHQLLSGRTHRFFGPVAPSSHSARPRVGVAHIKQLTAYLPALVESDDRHGGTEAVERRAAQLARQTLGLQQQGTATSRVRAQLYSLGATFTSSAMWAAIDGRRLDAAQRYMHEAVTLAGLSGDSAIQFRVWGHAASLYRQLGRYHDAIAADSAARATSVFRRDPLYASLAHARTAAHHGDLHDHSAVKRSIDLAQDALARADLSAARPAWMRFYDQAELELLALIAHFALSSWADAEAYGHRTLALLRPDLVRNRSLALVYTAWASRRRPNADPLTAYQN